MKRIFLSPRVPIGDLADVYCADRKLKPRSARQLRWQVSQFVKWARQRLGREPIVDDFLDGLANEYGESLADLKPISVSTRVKPLIAIWRYAAARGIVLHPDKTDKRLARRPRPNDMLPELPERRPELSLASSLEDLLADYRLDRTIVAETAQQMRITLRQFSAWFVSRYGQMPTIETTFDRRTMHEWLDHVAEKLKPATCNSKRTNMVALWNYAADPPLELVKPPRKIKRFIVAIEPPNAWTIEEFDRLLRAALETPGEWDGVPAGQCWYAGLLVIWDTACRFNELKTARVADVDFEGSVLRVPAANRKGRRNGKVYALHRQTLDAIRRTLDAPPRTTLWPFPYFGTGRPRSVWREFGEILERAGLPNTPRHKFHALRRTAESYAALKLGPEGAAAAVGHTVAVAQRHYLSPDVYRAPALIDALPRPRARAPKPTLLGRVSGLFGRKES